MNLVVHLPYDTTDESESALSAARRAPTFTIEWVKDRRMAVAVFPALPAGIDLAVQLVGEAVRLPDAWASVNSTPLPSLTRLWQRLVCYRDSLGSPEPVRYCLEKSAHFHSLVGCEAHRCPVSCQFMCQPCLGMTQDTRATGKTTYRAAAVLAEIDWCPRLNLPSDSPLITLSRTP